MLNQQYWDTRYQSQQTNWDLGQPSPPLRAYIDQLTEKNLRILIPGGGNSYEAVYLLEAGFAEVSVVDVSAVVVESLQQRYQVHGLSAIHQDFFDHEGSYDLILEQTFFCALDPSLRPAYVQKMNELLTTNGKLVGLLFNRSFEGGPPFGGSEAEYRALFAPYFEIKKMETAINSIAPRAGSELFFSCQKKQTPPN
jgi:methyl halide transferase